MYADRGSLRYDMVEDMWPEGLISACWMIVRANNCFPEKDKAGLCSRLRTTFCNGNKQTAQELVQVLKTKRRNLYWIVWKMKIPISLLKKLFQVQRLQNEIELIKLSVSYHPHVTTFLYASYLFIYWLIGFYLQLFFQFLNF